MKRSPTVLLMSLGLASLGAPFLGCRSAQQIDAQQVELPAGTQWDDSQITAAVRDQLAADLRLAAARFGIATREGVVTLTGRVKTDAEKTWAARIARDTSGVRQVQDLVKVGHGWTLNATIH